MPKTKKIAIILPDTLQSTGLQTLLVEYFHPVEVCYFPAFDMFVESDPFDYYFTTTETFVIYSDYFLPRKHKTALLIQDSLSQQIPGTSHYLEVRAPQELLIEQLYHFLNSESNTLAGENNKDLSTREIDVLQLIVKGSTNKDIADKLNISLNTVLTHRKNITSKLGIKTVSGLTYYALMNGIVSSDDIEL